MRKKPLKESVQKLFEHECREYIFCHGIYSFLLKQEEAAESEQEELEEKQEEIEYISTLKDVLSSQTLEKAKKILKESAISILMRSITTYLQNAENMEEKIQGELDELESELIDIKNLLRRKRKELDVIKYNLLSLISYTSENNVELTITEEISEVAIKAFIEYYKESRHFEKERNVINTKNSTLPENFKKAYITSEENGHSKEEVAEAQKWFEEQARKNNFF